MKQTTILLLHSIGDIIFCEPIFLHYYTQDGKKPVVIIRDHLIWIQQYITTAIFLKASQWRGDIDTMDHGPEYGFVNLRFANQIYRGYDPNYHDDFENMMLDKYRLIGLDENYWKNIELKFDWKKGEELFKKLELFQLDNYVLKNKHSQAGDVDMQIKTNHRIVEMQFIDGFNVIDWALVIKQADKIHSVSTSTFFIFQALKNKGWKEPDIKIYPRPNVDGLRGISQLKPDFKYESMERIKTQTK